MARKDNRFPVCLSDDLLAIEKEIIRRERYRSHTECYESFLRHWAISQQEHALTGGWASLPPDGRDTMIPIFGALLNPAPARRAAG